MSLISLKQLLDLVGTLDDSLGEETPRARFRRFLKSSVTETGQVRDYVEECLRSRGDQYNRALQDLVNYTGQFLGFEVTFGRYRGVEGQIGFDGHWRSPSGFHLVIEVKTTETYAVKTATLVNYVDRLISEKKISDWGSALGLYVVGRPDPDVRQLENAIVAERRAHQLRIISVDSLLSLAEMMSEYDISHADIMAVLQPAGPTVDSVIDLMGRLVAQQKPEGTLEKAPPSPEPPTALGASYWLASVKSVEEESAEECIQSLVGKEGIFAFSERAPGRKHLKPGGWLCFYASGIGVVAHARVSSSPEKMPHRRVRHPEKYPWTFSVDNVRLYLEKPVVVDSSLRSRLDAFEGRDPDAPWSWFVLGTRNISERDFNTLIRS